LQLGTAAAALPAGARFALADNYPSRPVHLIVDIPAGLAPDVLARLLAEPLSHRLSQDIVVEDKPGAGGNVGAEYVIRSAPDGYTLLVMISGNAANAALYPNLDFNFVRDIVPVAFLGYTPFAVTIHPSIPATTLAELVAYAKANPGALSYGSAGAGTLTNLAGELFKQLIGAPDIVHIPYKGSAPGLTDLASGHIPMMTPNIGGALLDFHRSGKVRILAVAAETRLRAAPDIPTATEAGLPGMVAANFNGLFAPAGLAPAIVDQLATATRSLMADAAFDQLLLQSGFEPTADSGPDQARRLVTEEVTRWAPIMRATNFKME
jgi:tripartite-type tricarboxylate transporter receptor subunit TctC